MILKKHRMSLPLSSIDPTWTLFLDRDGVINERIVGDYVKSRDQFHFLPGVLEAMPRLASLFAKIVVVSNQQGIGKGVMSVQELNDIHEKMTETIRGKRGRIDLILFSPDLAGSGSFTRKPNIGMALQAKKRFPEIIFKKSVMAGDSLSDMIFGKRLGMLTVLISTDHTLARENPRVIDFVLPDLKAFVDFINKSIDIAHS